MIRAANLSEAEVRVIEKRCLLLKVSAHVNDEVRRPRALAAVHLNITRSAERDDRVAGSSLPGAIVDCRSLRKTFAPGKKREVARSCRLRHSDAQCNGSRAPRDTALTGERQRAVGSGLK